jgi:DNA-binding PadR family transcriptional regulator
MGTEKRITQQTEKILATLLTDPLAEWWGAQIAKAAGLKSGTLYPALLRMERFGWLTSEWEDIDPSEEGRPRKRFYRLTGEGQRVAEGAARDAEVRARRRERKQNRWSGAPGGVTT